MGVKGAATTGVGAGNPFPQLGSRGEVGTLSKLSAVSSSLFLNSSSKGEVATSELSLDSFFNIFCFSSSNQERNSSLSFSLEIAHIGGGTSQSSSLKKKFDQDLFLNL